MLDFGIKNVRIVGPHAQGVQAVDSESRQGYTPFQGQELTEQVEPTFLRGKLIYEDGNVVGPATGRRIYWRTR